ncbi:MAG: hypothetical protein V3T64_09235 [Myxococcota bacterium]
MGAKTKAKRKTKLEAALNLLRAIDLAVQAGGDTIGLINGVQPIHKAVYLRHYLEDGVEVEWIPGAGDDGEYGLRVGSIELRHPGALSTKIFPVRKRRPS